MQRTIYATQQDLQRLERLLDSHVMTRDADALSLLEERLGRAQVVPPDRLPADVVTMNSRVLVRDEESGEERELAVVYPKDADASAGRISVLAPTGVALLGLPVGRVAEVQGPAGSTRRLQVVAIPYQPEAAGHRHL